MGDPVALRIHEALLLEHLIRLVEIADVHADGRDDGFLTSRVKNKENEKKRYPRSYFP